ncbi:MAG: 23S rRNA (adenine(2503)-C(2))-methyltransferase RlmN [Planctomycetota bacterium]|nr:MAG: 23S rRNA (adenine(2503)-C(2))-methyltransferase RlmN [Planctomycetota bacterium]REJ89991.1 MAG: 23S rRNA (adenine(2503)-C(2))-methyltransferase RlmN [Planctomycetota bacterium]REK28242.1 MAG: 23S rRNA (adenine(2503)-C(2))-methyltransferase RlmN [Planctomycetota bacterium]REK39765.1 MAG: 23S rRNA (adenine(2503)-C(2))-methyltransferase RlmN [Planctomycetota bacterium]
MHLLDLSDGQLEAWLAERDQPAFRARQIRRWLFASRATDFADMTDLPAGLRDQLAADFRLWTTGVAAHHVDPDGTEKLLFELADGQQIESVLLRDGTRRTICISTQVGCAMGCVFCATGLDGVVRNLTRGEIVEQMLRLARLLPPGEGHAPAERLSHIVVMGMGEPLANLDALLPALGEAESKDGLGISPRRITISTVGLPAAIDRLSDLGTKYNLAVSLHAADDELRERLVPVGKKIALADILAAADRYFDVSGRRLTFEYVLLAEVNDREEDARRLARLLAGRGALLNLIPYNAVAGLPYQTPSEARTRKFIAILERQGVNVQTRRRKGAKIDAACGQLRRIKGEVPSTVVPLSG